MSSRIKKQKGKSSPKGRGRVTRKTSRGPQITQVPGRHFYADGERATLKYSDQYIITQGASGGAISYLQYAMNSLFHANVTAATGTPQGVAELVTKFLKYRVMGSRIHWRIRILQPGGTFGSLGVLGVQATGSDMMSAVMYPQQTGAAALTSVNAAAVQKYASKRFDWNRDLPIKAGVYEPYQINPATVWTGRAAMTVAKLDADPDPAQASYTAAFGANPTNLCLWNLVFQDVLADATAKGVWLSEVEVEYDVYAFDRIQVGDALRDTLPRALVMGVNHEEKKDPLSELLPVSEPISPSLSPFPALKTDLDSYALVKRTTLAALSARRS